jgi:hypothetical protein
VTEKTRIQQVEHPTPDPSELTDSELAWVAGGAHPDLPIPAVQKVREA